MQCLVLTKNSCAMRGKGTVKRVKKAGKMRKKVKKTRGFG